MPAASTPYSHSPPNVLLLLTDQQRYDCTVAPELGVKTPHIDRLMREGVSFENAYTPIGICSSARASLLTGLYPHTHGMLNNCHGSDALEPNLSTDHDTLGDTLSAAGYRVTNAGKWHVGRDQSPSEFGFEALSGTENAATSTAFHAYQQACGIDEDEPIELTDTIVANAGTDEILVAATTSLPPEATWTYYLAERTIAHLESLADGQATTDEPFFHRTDFEGPHHPYVVPEPYASMYDPAAIEPWENFRETFDGKPHVHEQFVRYRGVADFGWDIWASAIARYFGFLTFIDAQIGRILEALESTGLAETTVVIHAADHGDMTGSHRQFNKGPAMYEEVYHIPLIVRGPGVAAGAKREELVRLHDLMPTILDFAGCEPPAHIAGHSRSLRPLLERGPDDESVEWPDTLCAEYHGDEFGLYSQRLVRRGQYKLVYNAFDTNELYDLKADSGELQNLISHPDYGAIKRDLLEALLTWMDDTDDPIATWTRRGLEAQLGSSG